MDRKPFPVLSVTVAALAAVLLLSFFRPWLTSLGKPVSGPEIRSMLEGPHRLISLFDSGSRVSADYRLSAFLWAVPGAAACVLAAIALRRFRAWMAALAGAVAVAAFFFLKREVAGFPFHRLAWGSYLALAAGAGLLLSPLLRLLRLPGEAGRAGARGSEAVQGLPGGQPEQGPGGQAVTAEADLDGRDQGQVAEGAAQGER